MAFAVIPIQYPKPLLFPPLPSFSRSTRKAEKTQGLSRFIEREPFIAVKKSCTTYKFISSRLTANEPWLLNGLGRLHS